MATAYLSAFSGSNLGSASTITNPDTASPTLNITPSNPDPLDNVWQQYLVGVSGVAGKTLNVVVNTTNKEFNGLYESTYDGPWWSTDPTSLTWNKVSSFTSNASTLLYTIEPGAADVIYIASLPPWTLGRTLTWINDLKTNYPSLVHDDLKPRVRKAIGPYICGISGTHKDETGRTVSGLPLYGFRIGNDAVTPTYPEAKRELVILSGVHCHEWNGPISMMGFIEDVLSNPALSTLRDNFNIYVYPAHSVGGIELGFRRQEAINSTSQSYDANRYWSDGAATVNTIVLWQDIIDEQHGVFLHNVVGYLDFHDADKDIGTYGKAFYYYMSSMANFSTISGIITTEEPELNPVVMSVSTTTTEYFFDKGVNYALNIEIRDERDTLAQVKNYGRSLAKATQTIFNSNLLNDYNGVVLESPEIESFETGTGLWTLNTGSQPWTRSNTATPTSSTGADAAFSGSWRVFTEAGASGTPVAEGTTFVLERTGIDFNKYAEMRFRYMRQGCVSSTFAVQVDSGSGYLTKFSTTVNQTTQLWRLEGVDLSNETAVSGKIRFLVTVSGTNRHLNDQDVDYIEFVPYGAVGENPERLVSLSQNIASVIASSQSQNGLLSSVSSLLNGVSVSSAATVLSGGVVDTSAIVFSTTVNSDSSNRVTSNFTKVIQTSVSSQALSSIELSFVKQLSDVSVFGNIGDLPPQTCNLIKTLENIGLQLSASTSLDVICEFTGQNTLIISDIKEPVSLPTAPPDRRLNFNKVNRTLPPP